MSNYFWLPPNWSELLAGGLAGIFAYSVGYFQGRRHAKQLLLQQIFNIVKPGRTCIIDRDENANYSIREVPHDKPGT